jgi:hypothetical protein
MKTKHYILTLIALFSVIVIGGLWQYNKPARDLAKESADLSISAPELYHQFSENEAQANQHYLDKVVQVKGKLQAINRGNAGVLNLILDSGSPMGGVICEVPAGNMPKGSNLQTGQELTLKGQCTGYLMDVVLVKCVIVP